MNPPREMKPLPGEIHREPWSKFGRIVLTDEQREWLREVFPTNPTRSIAKVMGIGESTLSHFAYDMGLCKSKEYKDKLHREAMLHCIDYNFKHGVYQSASFKEHFRQWQRAGVDAWQAQLAAMTEAERKAWYKKRGVAAKATRDADIRRVNRGMPQRTKFRNLSWPYDTRHYSVRSLARRKNYIVIDYPSGADRYNIYYDSETERAPKFEKHAETLGFRFLEDK